MRILITNAPRVGYQVNRVILRGVPVVNLPLLGAVARSRGHEARLLDNSLVRLRSENILPTVARWRPDVVGISNNCMPDNAAVRRVIAELKRRHPSVVVVAGGQFPSQSPRLLLEAGADYVVVGEGEVTFGELLDHLAAPGTRAAEDIAGLAFEREGEVVLTPPRPQLDNLDDSPIPAFDLLERYPPALTRRGRPAAIETRRGCVNGCSFCEVTRFWKRSCRRKSLERVLEELDLLHRLGFDELTFIDDSIDNDAPMMEALFEEMIRRRYGFTFIVQITAECVANNPRYIDLMSRAGLRFAVVGFESYRKNPKESGKKATSLDVNRVASERLRRAGVVIMGTHAYGLPHHDEEELELIERYGPELSDLFRAGLYVPLSTSIDAQTDGGHGDYVIKGKLSRAQVVRKFYAMHARYWFHPRTIVMMFRHDDWLVRRLMQRSYVSNVLAVYYLVVQNRLQKDPWIRSWR